MTTKQKHRKPRRGFSEREIRVIMARAELMVDCLRNYWISWGWRLSESEARDFLRKFRVGLGGITRYEEDVYKWLCEHGQSLDWLLRGDTRSLILGAVINSEAVKRSRELTIYTMKKEGFKITEPSKQKEAA